MINFDSLTLKAQIAEIEPILTAGRVQKIQQPSKHELLIGIRSLGKSHKLYLNVDPKYPHICLLTKEGEAFRCLEIPQKPPMFCMLLRKHMEGAKIKEVNQPNYERILEIYFDSYNEIGAKSPMVLAVELMGKHSNIILYNYDTNVILGCAHPVSSEKSREREVAGSLPYIYPPKQKKIDLTSITKEEFYIQAKLTQEPLNYWLNHTFYHISLALANEICKIMRISVEKDQITAISKDKILELYEKMYASLSLKGLNPSISNDYKTYSLFGADSDIDWTETDSVNKMIELYFSHHVYEDKLKRQKMSLLASVNKELKKLKTKLSKHNKTFHAEEKADKYRQIADIIMANLYNIKPNSKQVELQNIFEENESVFIQLDPVLSANDNAQRYYKLYNKTKIAASISKKFVDEINESIEYFEGIQLSILNADAFDELNQIKEELIDQNIIKVKVSKTSKPKKHGVEVEEYLKMGKFRIYLGKNNKQNDYIISKIASANDLWLHAQNIPGSHVLIKVPQESHEVPDEVLLRAAQIAAYHSKAGDSTNVPVICTKKKYLKRPPGAKPGYVTYSHEEEFYVNPEK